MRDPGFLVLCAALALWGTGSGCPLRAAALPQGTAAEGSSQDGMNCFAVVAGAGCTVDGSVIFAHNEDSGHRNPVRHWLVPAAEHQDIETRRLLNGGREPFAERTHGFLWCQMPGLRYSDTCFNRHGVAIATNGCHSKENEPDLTDGGITFMLRQIVAARATSARHGVEVAADLLGRYGYADTGRTMTIADPREAWVMNIARGKHWVAARVPDDRCAVIANHFTIHRVDLADRERFRASPGLIEHARKRGWYDPARDGEFDFATVYGTDGARTHRSNIRRVWRACGLIAADPPAETWRLPTFVAPKKKLAVADLMEVLRDHYEGTSYDLSEGYTKGSPYRMKQPTICASGTSFSTVFQLRPGLPPAIGCVMWLALSRPDTCAYVPYHAGITALPDGLTTGDPEQALRRHFDPEFKAEGSARSVSAAQDLAARLEPRYGEYFPRLDRSRDAFETDQWQAQRRVEAVAMELHRRDPRLAAEYLTMWTGKQQARADQLVLQWSAEVPAPAQKEVGGGR